MNVASHVIARRVFEITPLSFILAACQVLL